MHGLFWCHLRRTGSKYETIITGLELLADMKTSFIEVIRDSELAVHQATQNFKCKHWHLTPYYALETQLIEKIDDVEFKVKSRAFNHEVKTMVQMVSRIKIEDEMEEELVRVQLRTMPSFRCIPEFVQAADLNIQAKDWRDEIKTYFLNHYPMANHKMKCQAIKYILRRSN